jgi:hypothetical protein
MYGLVNRAMQNLVTERFGESVWEEIRHAANVEVEIFSSNEQYADDVTYALVGAASRILAVPVPVLLEEFGKYWVTRTAVESYGSLMGSTGGSVKEFLLNLPNLHSHVKMIFPNLRPPTFVVTDVTEQSLLLHYHTFRVGLRTFVVGLLHGLGQLYGTPVTVTSVAEKLADTGHDIFLVEWQSTPATPTRAN